MRLLATALLLSIAGTTPAGDPLPGGQPAAASAPAPAKPCHGANWRAFDFWIGTWDVYGRNGALVGTNTIEPVLDGCALREHWRNANGQVEGFSFSLYDGLRREWVQYWVDNSGGTLVLSGQRTDGTMDLRGERPNPATGRSQKQRVRWIPGDDGSVRQWWETSDDNGATWQTSFDGTYRRR